MTYSSHGLSDSFARLVGTPEIASAVGKVPRAVCVREGEELKEEGEEKSARLGGVSRYSPRHDRDGDRRYPENEPGLAGVWPAK